MKFSLGFVMVIVAVFSAWFAMWGYLFFSSAQQTDEANSANLFVPLTAAAPMMTLTAAAIFAWAVRRIGKRTSE